MVKEHIESEEVDIEFNVVYIYVQWNATQT